MPAGGGTTGRYIRRLLSTDDNGTPPTTGALAEACIARRLLHAGCDLEIELETPNGRTCDFEVSLNGTQFFLHVKSPKLPPRTRSTLPSFLRSIEQVPRPFLVEVDWRNDLNETQLAAFAAEARSFVKEARMGEELLHRDRSGRVAGNVRIGAPVDGNRAVVAVVAFDQPAISRVGRLLERAYDQFMPGGENVILIMTDDPAHDRLTDLALLGTYVERWDKLPRGDRHVAHGRAQDGFWAGQRFNRSRVVSWMPIDSEHKPARVWFRQPDTPDHELRAMIAGVLGAE